MTKNSRKIRLGISPCPNDTYIFHALLHGLTDTALEFDVLIADVEELNTRACKGELECTKVSVGVVPHILAQYALLTSGAALGWGCGPIVVAKTPMTAQVMRTASIAIPGRMTTASLLLDLHGGFQGERQEMPFDNIMSAVLQGQVDCGVIIHEGRFTFASQGLVALLDMGQWWEHAFAMPLPLGTIAVRRDIGYNTARRINKAIRASLCHAHAHPEASQDFIRHHAQEMFPDVIVAHIRTFVTAHSDDLGLDGSQAIQTLVERACQVRRLSLKSGLFFDTM